MYISPRALEGSRRYRLAAGVMLVLGLLAPGAGMTVAAVSGDMGGLGGLALGSVGVSLLVVAWWAARYWYAAFLFGRREEPVPDPDPWPWMLPWTALMTVAIVGGVRQLTQGNSGGWFALGFGAIMAVPWGLMVAAGVLALRERWRGRGAASPGTAGSGAPSEPPRPRRDWGPIG
ncbi:hypothetical protein [Streptomyces sp. NPDC088360]|uniref:hypothetical protein n=1 Tax=Streptomyces sp. NPDC088360 TaxID=3154515 RepID=UPI00344BBE4B